MSSGPIDANGCDIPNGARVRVVGTDAVGRVIASNRYDAQTPGRPEKWESYVEVDDDRALYNTTSLIVIVQTDADVL